MGKQRCVRRDIFQISKSIFKFTFPKSEFYDFTNENFVMVFRHEIFEIVEKIMFFSNYSVVSAGPTR